jgi:GH3 auxin-responsive promoter
MAANPWDRLSAAIPASSPLPWLETLLARNAGTEYLRAYGSPRTMEEFRERVPVVSYEDLTPWIDRICGGAAGVLFAGSPIAFERTGGSTGAAKLIPYSAAGLADFQRSVVPWLNAVVDTYGITGPAYFSISPATRQRNQIGGIPVGLPDGAYLGDIGGAVLAEMTAVPLAVAAIDDVSLWRAETIRHLTAAYDLELISVWSPTFLLSLLDQIDEPQYLWPHLKVISCWTSAASKPFAKTLAARLPQAHLQPKGLLSTETVVTVPDRDDRPVLTEHGFFEFEREGRLYLHHELLESALYEVIATTASGLYRYRTGDMVRHEGRSHSGLPILEFAGRGDAVSDLVGEKLTETFVAACLEDVPGFRLLVPAADSNGYVLMTETGTPVSIGDVEQRLCDNPQYAYARRIGQLAELRLMPVSRLYDRYARAQMEQGILLGDVKPAALRKEPAWAGRLEEQ